jgi:hypothetical protein
MLLQACEDGLLLLLPLPLEEGAGRSTERGDRRGPHGGWLCGKGACVCVEDVGIVCVSVRTVCVCACQIDPKRQSVESAFSEPRTAGVAPAAPPRRRS